MATTLFLLQEGGDRGHFDCLLRQGKFCHKGTVDAGACALAVSLARGSRSCLIVSLPDAQRARM